MVWPVGPPGPPVGIPASLAALRLLDPIYEDVHSVLARNVGLLSPPPDLDDVAALRGIDEVAGALGHREDERRKLRITRAEGRGGRLVVGIAVVHEDTAIGLNPAELVVVDDCPLANEHGLEANVLPLVLVDERLAAELLVGCHLVSVERGRLGRTCGRRRRALRSVAHQPAPYACHCEDYG